MFGRHRHLLHFDELDCDPVGSLDHSRAQAAPRADLLERLYPFALQSRHRCWQIRCAERPVINNLSARADEAATRPRANQDRDVAEADAAGWVAHETGFRKRRPRRRRVQLGMAIAVRRRYWPSAASLRDRSTEVRRVPLHRAQRVLVIHVYVVETLRGASLRVLDHRAVGAAEVAEAALARRLHALRPHLENLLLRWQPR